MEDIKFIVYGNPMGKQRPRFRRLGNKIMTYTPPETKEYENLVAKSFVEQCNSPPFEADVPLWFMITAKFQIPKSYTKRQRQAIEEGQIYPLKKPDLDNICKIVMDGLNGIAYEDDSQIAGIVAHKVYTHGDPMILVEIREMVTKNGM